MKTLINKVTPQDIFILTFITVVIFAGIGAAMSI